MTDGQVGHLRVTQVNSRAWGRAAVLLSWSPLFGFLGVGGHWVCSRGHVKSSPLVVRHPFLYLNDITLTGSTHLLFFRSRPFSLLRLPGSQMVIEETCPSCLTRLYFITWTLLHAQTLYFHLLSLRLRWSISIEQEPGFVSLESRRALRQCGEMYTLHLPSAAQKERWAKPLFLS